MTGGGHAGDAMKHARLYADKDGESHFEDVDVEFASVDFAPPAPRLNLSDATPAKDVSFLSLPAGWKSDGHVAPGPMMLFILAGEVEITASDGTARRFPPGSALAVEDTTGKGHAARVLGDEEVLAACAGLGE